MDILKREDRYWLKTIPIADGSIYIELSREPISMNIIYHNHVCWFMGNEINIDPGKPTGTVIAQIDKPILLSIIAEQNYYNLIKRIVMDCQVQNIVLPDQAYEDIKKYLNWYIQETDTPF